jgi:hypothetical protein
MLVFKHFKNDPGSICAQFTEDKIRSSIIIRDEATGNYLMTSRANLRELYDILREAIEAGSPKSWHEIIPSFVPQRLRMDIDIAAKDLESIRIEEYISLICPDCHNSLNKSTYWCDKCRAARGNYLKARCAFAACKMALIEVMNAQLAAHNINSKLFKYIICESNGVDKFSYHIITNVYSNTSAVTNSLACEIHDKINEKYRKFNDVEVSKRGTASLRTCMSVKMGTQRLKTIFRKNRIPTFEQWLETLVTNPEMDDLQITDSSMMYCPESSSEGIYGYDTLPDNILQAALKLCAGLEFTTREGYKYLFRRIEPGFCGICGRIHDNDNSLIVVATRRGFIAKCRRKQGTLVKLA